MILIYRFLTNLTYPLIILIIFLRKYKRKEDKTRYKEKLFSKYFNVKRDHNKKLFWFHAASVGEFKSIIPIIKELNKEQKNLEFLVTTVTLSSGNLARDVLKNFKNVQHRFFPVDVDFVIKKFLKNWKPNVIFLVDSEIWPNLIINARKYKIPMALINARITIKSFKRWMMILPIAKKIFKNFNLCLSSNKETEKYLSKLNANNIFYAGNLKLIDNNISTNKNIKSEQGGLTVKKNWCAISTHDDEEKFCLKVHLNIKNKYNDSSVIIAPRHLERVKDIKKLCEYFSLNCQILNKEDLIKSEADVVIINSFGNLTNFIRSSKSVFMGKSLLKKYKTSGGQNPIEAAKLGCKVYHGPYISNFNEIYEILAKNNISKKIENDKELINFLLEDFKKQENNSLKNTLFMSDLSKKTLAQSMDHINKFLSNEINKA